MVYPEQIEVSMYDGEGAFFPAAYQKLVTRVMEKHLETIGMDVPLLMRTYGVSWVLLSLSLELKRPLRPNEQLCARTWHTSHVLPIYRREIALYGDTGEAAAVGTTFSTVFDLKTRRICTDRSVLKHFEMPDGEVLLEAGSRFSSAADFVEVEQRTVRPSWQDGLGHVNNARYGEVVYDALDDSQRLALRQLKRLDVWFMAEMTPGMRFSVQKACIENGVIVKGVLEKGKTSFAMRLAF